MFKGDIESANYNITPIKVHIACCEIHSTDYLFDTIVVQSLHDKSGTLQQFGTHTHLIQRLADMHTHICKCIHKYYLTWTIVTAVIIGYEASSHSVRRNTRLQCLQAPASCHISGFKVNLSLRQYVQMLILICSCCVLLHHAIKSQSHPYPTRMGQD